MAKAIDRLGHSLFFQFKSISHLGKNVQKKYLTHIQNKQLEE